MKRKMDPFETFHVDRLCERGCAACGTHYNVCWHHFIHKITGGRLTKIHLFGCPLCADCHQNGSDALHKDGNENEWCQRHNIRKTNYIDEVGRSLTIWVAA